MWHPIRRAQGSVQGHRATCRDTKSCAGTQRSLQKCKIMCRDTKECAGTQSSFQGHRVEWRNTKGCSETRSDVWGQKGECRDTKVVPGTQKEMWTHPVLLRDTEEPASLTTEGLWSSMSKPSTLWCTSSIPRLWLMWMLELCLQGTSAVQGTQQPLAGMDSWSAWLSPT